jgi:hypothetical protein
MLEHTNVKTTQIYAKVVDEKKQGQLAMSRPYCPNCDLRMIFYFTTFTLPTILPSSTNCSM